MVSLSVCTMSPDPKRNLFRALAVQVDESMRRAVLIDVLTVYGATGKAIIFTKTKRAADEVAAGVALTIPCEVSSLILPVGKLI